MAMAVRRPTHRRARLVNSARTLADRFRTQRTDRIRVDGIEVLSLTELSISNGDAVEVVVEQFRDDVKQSLNIRAKSGSLQVLSHDAAEEEDEYEFDGSITSESITLVANLHRRIEFALAAHDEERGPVTLQFWNSWLLGSTEHAWTGNSGLVAEELDVPDGADARFRLWCSDGLGDPQFDNLVVVITIGPQA